MLKNNPAKAQRLLALEWASLPKDTSNRGAYSGQGGKVKSSEVREAFKQVLAGGSGERTIEKITGSDEDGDRSAGLELDGSGGVGQGKMITGPAGYNRIGAGAAYHVDTKFHRSLGMGNMISAMDKLAGAYAARGKEIVFSGQGYARLKGWSKDWDLKEKKKVLQSAIDAHSHSTFMRAQGFLPFDYYIPDISAKRDLYHKSTEGAEILLPTFGGKQKVGSLYGGYGKSADLFTSGGKHVAMTGHGDLHYSEGGYTKGYEHQVTVGEQGKEFIMDADSTKALATVFPGLLSALNKADYSGTLKVLRNYAEYEVGASQEVGVPQQVADVIIASVPKPTPVLVPVGGGGVSDDHRAILDNGH